MLTGICHCGAVRIEIPRRPRSLTSCNCSICGRYGTLWAYFKAASVRVIAARGTTTGYSWGRKTIRFVHCSRCGCVTHYERIRSQMYMGVNARMFASAELGTTRIRRLDGASTWKYLD